MDSVEDDEDAVNKINGTDYGLIGGVFCDDLERVERICGTINAGTVLANTIYNSDARLPMSGRKSSGRNILYSELCYRHFYRTKSMHVKINH